MNRSWWFVIGPFKIGEGFSNVQNGEKVKAKLILARGLPGSGKTTLIRSSYKHILHLENDMFHMVFGCYQFKVDRMEQAHNWCESMVYSTMVQKGGDIAVSNTFITLDSLKIYLNLVRRFSDLYEVTIITCRDNYGTSHNVPADIIDGMKASWQEINGDLLKEYPEIVKCMDCRGGILTSVKF